jgi:hypothetical protein
MAYIVAINSPDAGHLAEVIDAMRSLGAPAIRAFWTGEIYVALEGSHRLAAAQVLGLTPIIIKMADDEEMETDIDGLTDDDGYLIPQGSVVHVARILAYLDQSGPRYAVEG